MNKCYYHNITTKVWVAFIEKFKGFFVVYCAVEIMSANACTFVFCFIVKYMYFVYGNRKWLLMRFFRLLKGYRLFFRLF